MLLLLLSVAFLTFVATFVIVKRLTYQHSEQFHKERFKSRVGLKSSYQKQNTKIKIPWWCLVGRALGTKNAKEIEANRSYLVSAGYREDYHLGGYFLIKTLFILGVVLLVLAGWTWFQLDPALALVISIAALLAPERILMAKGKARLNKINLALPDFLDMANVCMNAGLSYLEAIKRVSAELGGLYPEICFEFQFLLEQIKIGVPRHEALRQFAKRNNTKDINEFMQVLIQNEKLGSPISQAINEFSRRMYQSRENQMEEKAAKTSAKMAIVIVPFLMLPYFILMLGERMVMLGRNW